MLAAPPLDAGAKGARLEVAPIESRRRREGAPPPPSSTCPIRPTIAGPPLLDAGAEGARLEVPPIESPRHAVAGKVRPFEPPLLAHFESDGKPPSELAST